MNLSFWGLARSLLFPDPGSPMLRISAIEAAGGTITLRLDGQITGRWVMLLQRTCEAELKKGAQVTIDLKNVSFADRDGIALLRSLTDSRVELLNSLPFIAEQIRKVTRD
jgi:ABC-type transporter Mla MlaB component